MALNLEDWEAIIEKIVNETNQAGKRSGRQRVLKNWRAQLQQEPNHLQAFQIDVIVREVQRRLKDDET
jgi:hypothetical protein